MAAVAAPPVVTLGKDAGPLDARISRWDEHGVEVAVAAQDTTSPADVRRIMLVQARWRGRRARRLYKSVVKRAYIVREVWQTERAYVESLKFTHERTRTLPTKYQAYELGLRDRLTKGSPIASEKYIDAIFYEVSTLLACNKSLLEQLDARVTKWNCDSVLGDIFVERASQAYRIQSKSFEVYTSFVNNFDRAMAYVRKLNTNEAFQKFVAQLDSTTRSRLRLNDFLIMPIQRIPRYELLLEQMLNATPAWHADHALLKSAVKEIKRVADYVNEKKREVEAAAKVKELQAKLSSDCPPLVTEQRRLIRDGDVVVAIKNERAMRHIFLFNDAILSSVRVDGSQGGIAKCEHGVLSNRQVFSSNVEYNFEWMVPLVNLIHITPLEKPVRARHHEPDMLMKKIKEIERQIHVERTIEKSAARIAQIYKAEHSKASKHQAKTTVGETESKIEQLTKQLKDNQALIRLNEPTVGLTLATDNHMTVTLVLRSPAQRTEWMTEIVKYRQIRHGVELDMLRRMEEDAALTATKPRASKDKGAATGWSIKTFVQGTTSSISSTLSRKAGRTAAPPGPGGKDAPAPAPAPATGAKTEPPAGDRRTSAPAAVGMSGAKQGSSKSITPSIRVAAPRASAAAIITAPPVPPGPPASAPVKPSIFRFGHSRGSSVTQPPASADKATDAPPGPVATPSSQTQAESTTPTPAPATATTESVPSSAAPVSATPAPATPVPASAPASAPELAEAPAGGLRETRASSATAEEASPPTAGLAGADATNDAAPAPSSAPEAPEPAPPAAPAEAAQEPAKPEAVSEPAKMDEDVPDSETPAPAAEAVAPPDVVVVTDTETVTDASEAPASPGVFSDGEAAEAAHPDETVDAPDAAAVEAAAGTMPFLSPGLPASDGGASASVSLNSLVSPRPAPLTMVITSAALQGGDSPLSGGFSMVPLERAAAHSSHEEIKAIADEVELSAGATALPPIDEELELEEESAPAGSAAAAAGPADTLTSPEPEPSLDRLDVAIGDADVDSLATTEVDLNYSELSAIDQHSFEPCKLERKVYCQVCDELMRAGSKDAVKCTRCSFRCHADCVKNASAACTHMPDMLIEDALNLGTLFHIDSPMV